MIRLRDLLGYLVGRAEAARRIAAHPRALVVGFCFVLAAGFAREYDGEDLLAEPWHLALPLVASLVTSVLLYVLLRLSSENFAKPPRRPVPPAGASHPRSDAAGYVAFLRLYWSTAPLALLYALPFERWMSETDALRANLLLLGLVALWRVVLITRAVSVVWRAPFFAVLFPVMLFADAVVLLLLLASPRPVIVVMGGLRLSATEAVLQSVTTRVFFLGFLTAPLWALGSLVARRWLRRSELGWAHMARVERRGQGISRPLLVVTLLSLLVWVAVLPGTQAEQRHRRRIDEALVAGRHAEAVAHVRGLRPEDLPPHWDPPPRPASYGATPDPVAVLAAALEGDAPPWFASRYVEKVEAAVPGNLLWEGRAFEDDEDADAWRSIREALPDYAHADALVAEHGRVLRAIVERSLQGVPMTPEVQQLLGPRRAAPDRDR